MVADYYDVLGVGRGAGQDEIKKAFRRLARDTHPDANPGDPTAEARFRDVARAYEVLSDPAKRAAYDRGGSFEAGDLFSSFAGIDDLLSRFFGGGFGYQFGGGGRTGPAQGSDIGTRVSVTLEEAAAGAARQVRFRAAIPCESCSGSGSTAGVDLATCDQCHGQGSVRVTRQTILGATMAITACDRCRGRGKMIVEPCEACLGRGSIDGERGVEVDIPPGIGDGARIRVPGKGAAGDAGGRPGDLYVEVGVAPDPRFERHGADLIHRVKVGLAEAALGATAMIPVVGEDDFELEIPAGTQPGSVFRLARMGMPRLQRRGRGDLLVEVIVEVPDRLTAEQEASLRAFAELIGEQPAPPAKRRHRS
ncbi:MAG: J domain-containing protein [Actinobacteria bacterium]|nr:J domain-containing protein [Actinomycetota bacterium]